MVALSGGADSVALLDALVALRARRGLRLVAAHLDHGLRPESADDARFCEELCARLGVSIRIGHADVRARAERERGGIEEAARRERYAFLRRVRREEGAFAIATAHNRDDQAETLLLRLLRGSGRVGLGAISARRRGIVRPLLTVSREEVLAHLEERGLSWREDPTNADPRYFRNRVRHELLPYLETRFNPRIKETLAQTATILADEACAPRAACPRAFWPARAAARARRSCSPGSDLAAAPRAIARLAIRAGLAETGGLRGVRARHVERLLDLAALGTGLRAAPSPFPGDGSPASGSTRSGWARAQSRKRPFAYPLRVPGRVELPGGLAVEAGRRPEPVEGEPLPRGGARGTRRSSCGRGARETGSTGTDAR